MPDAQVIKPNRDFIRKVKAVGGDSVEKCYQCATCSVVCNLSPEDCPFPRKEMIWTQWGLGEKLMTDPDVWLCHQCSDCTVDCPRGARPGDVMAAIRRVAFEYFAFPGFMGRLLASPAGLPVLLLIPLLVIGALSMVHIGGDFNHLLSEPVEYGLFIPHGWIEALFISGNVLIFLFAAVGLSRFYRGMVQSWNVKPEKGFISATITASFDVVFHNRFNKCETSGYRKAAHMLVFFGFFGAFATAGLALILMIVAPDQYPPIPFTNPVKWLGNASGLAMLIGIVIILVQRSRDDEIAGQSTYGHSLFIWMLLIVAATGMLMQPLRIYDLREVAYMTYFIHLLVVFFLLWYAPYSQLGHMFYRTLAMIFARSIGREARELE